MQRLDKSMDPTRLIPINPVLSLTLGLKSYNHHHTHIGNQRTGNFLNRPPPHAWWSSTKTARGPSTWNWMHARLLPPPFMRPYTPTYPRFTLVATNRARNQLT